MMLLKWYFHSPFRICIWYYQTTHPFPYFDNACNCNHTNEAVCRFLILHLYPIHTGLFPYFDKSCNHTTDMIFWFQIQHLYHILSDHTNPFNRKDPSLKGQFRFFWMQYNILQKKNLINFTQWPISFEAKYGKINKIAIYIANMNDNKFQTFYSKLILVEGKLNQIKL